MRRQPSPLAQPPSNSPEPWRGSMQPVNRMRRGFLSALLALGVMTPVAQAQEQPKTEDVDPGNDPEIIMSNFLERIRLIEEDLRENQQQAEPNKAREKELGEDLADILRQAEKLELPDEEKERLLAEIQRVIDGQSESTRDLLFLVLGGLLLAGGAEIGRREVLKRRKKHHSKNYLH